MKLKLMISSLGEVEKLIKSLYIEIEGFCICKQQKYLNIDHKQRMTYQEHVKK